LLQSLGIEQLTPVVLALIVAGMILGGILIGAITDAVMTDRGFGMFGNGLLAVMGSVIGMHAKYAFLGPAYARDLALTGIAAAAGATAMLLIFGVIKHWVQD